MRRPKRPPWLDQHLAITWILLVSWTMALAVWGRDSLISLFTVAMYAVGCLMWCKAAYYRGRIHEDKLSKEFFSLFLWTLSAKAHAEGPAECDAMQRLLQQTVDTPIAEMRKLRDEALASMRAQGH